MNVSQIGQKKKKQAVRRLSQGPGGQGNRREDIRRKLEAKRRVAGSSSAGGERRLPRGNIRSAQTDESSANRPFSAAIKRTHSQTSSKRHASPLASTASTISSKEQKNIFTNPTATASNQKKNELTQGNVFGSNVFKSGPVQETASGSYQSKSNQESVFGSKGSPNQNQGNVFGSNLASNSTQNKTTFSAPTSDSRANKSHPSPLAGLMSSPSKSGGSIVSGLANKANPESSSVSSLLDNKTNFQKTPSNVFQTTVASTSPGLQSTFPQYSVFSAKQDTQDPTNARPIFGSNLSTSTSAPQNVNLFASDQTKTVVSSSATQHSNTNTTLFSGYMVNTGNKVLNTENNAPNTTLPPTNVFTSSLSQNSNPVTFNNLTGSPNLNPIGSTNPSVMNRNSPLKTGSLIGNTTLLMNSTEQGNSARIFGMSNSATLNSTAQDSSGSKTNVSPFSISVTTQSQALFNTGGQTQPKPERIVGTVGSSTMEQPKTSGIFSATQDPKSGPFSSGSKPTIPAFFQQPKPKGIFGNAGLSSGQQESLGTFPVPKNSKQGPFTSKTSNAGLSQQSNSANTFGNTRQMSTFSSAGFFSKQSNNMFGSASVSQAQESSRENSLASERRKGLKRSLSNTDTSNLTSILVKGLREEYLDKKLLEREFAIFGENKVSLQPTKQSAVVNFRNHESAKEAKSRAFKLFPFKDAHVFWCKKKGTGRLSKTPEKSTDNKKEFRSRRRSISNALNSIDVSKLPPAMNAQDRFTILEEVDKRIRQAITPYRDIANAPVIIGVCCDMCPEKERYMREYQANLSIFEMVPGTQDNRDGDVPKVEHIKAVKEYSRSAADKLEPLSHELRPVHVLQMTLDYLMANVMDNSEEKRDEWFNFLWNRTRAIRKDITQQHLCDVQSVDLVEKITRFHIFCAHYLCEEDIHSFDPKINDENLTKCLQTLKQFYVDLYIDQELKCPNEAEFQAYDILLNLNEGDTLRKAMQYRLEVRNSPEVKVALEVFSSLNSSNFVRFFKLLKSATYLNACIIHRYFTQVRRNALKVMTRAYSPNEPYPLQVLQDLLAFEDQDEASRFCSHYNFTTSEGCVQFSRMSFMDPDTAFPLQRAINAVESKRNCSIGEVVNGSPLVVRATYQPVSSFDAEGRYVGLSHLAQMLQNTPDTPEPESPYDIYESSINLSSEQRSPVTQVPIDDSRVILNKEQRHYIMTVLVLLEQTCKSDSSMNQACYKLLTACSKLVPTAWNEQSEQTCQQLVNRLVTTYLQAIESTCVDLVDETVDDMVKTISEDAVRQVDLELQLTNDFANKFIDDSLSIMLKEIAKECIRNEVEERRRKAEIADSRARMSVVVTNEIIKDFFKIELVSLAGDAKKIVRQQLRAQSFARMSAIVMKEMVEDVMYEQCREVAISARKDIIRQKKTVLWKKAEILRRRKLKRCFQTWSKEYHIRVHIRNLLKEMPANPPMLSTKQQLDKLLSNQDPTGRVPTTPALLSSLIKEREELQKLLTDKVNEREIKRLRAMQPINLRRLHTELNASKLNSTKILDSNDPMKLIVSFANHVEHFSLTSAESLIQFKLCTENIDQCRPVPAGLLRKFEQLSENQESTETLEFKYDIKACYGSLSSDELRKVQQHHLLLGLTGILFILDSSGQAEDKMFWSNCRTRLRQILRSKPRLPGIPLVIMNINSNVEQSAIEEQVDMDELRREGLISDCTVFAQQDPCDSDQLHNQLVRVLLWLMSNHPEPPTVQTNSLKGFVEGEILKHFTVPVYEETTLRKEALLQPQCPEVIVDLYNAVIDHVIAIVTTVKLKEISLPIPEFLTADSPPVSWNSTTTLARLNSILRKLKLPLPASAAADGTWHSEYILCLDYVNALLEEEPLKNFGFALINRVERILSPYANDSSKLPFTSLTAADVPWPEVIEACIKTLLSWVHTLSDVKNVYYLPQDLDEFKQPPLWTKATTETVKLIKRKSEVRKKTRTSKIHDMTIEVEEELTRLNTSHSRLDVSERESFVDDGMEERARRFERNLGKEKRNWKRFEDELRAMLDEDDPEDLNFGVPRQGIKRKNPSSGSGCSLGKTNVKKSSMKDLDLPDLNSTLSYFETSLVSLRDGLEMHRYLEKITEKKLKETLEDDFE